jgi:hypothetical protein
VDAFEGFGGAEAHFFGDDEVGPEAGGGEEAGDDGLRPVVRPVALPAVRGADC